MNMLIQSMNLFGYINPIRYRRYYYDKETGLYYLNARYYDPKQEDLYHQILLVFLMIQWEKSMD